LFNYGPRGAPGATRRFGAPGDSPTAIHGAENGPRRGVGSREAGGGAGGARVEKGCLSRGEDDSLLRLGGRKSDRAVETAAAKPRSA
jgi:hypothetical protein